MVKPKPTEALLVFFAALFLLGVSLGHIFCLKSLPLPDSLSNFSVQALFEKCGFGFSLCCVFFFCAFAQILSLTTFGFILIPLLFTAEGFFLSFVSASACALLGSGDGVLHALVFFLFKALLGLPVFFLLALNCYKASRNLFSLTLTHRPVSPLPFQKQYLKTSLICFSLLFLLALCDCFLSPYISGLLL